MTKKTSRSKKGGGSRTRAADPRADLQALADLLPEDRVREIARETGFIKRERTIDPVAMLWVLALGFGVSLQRDLETLRREYQRRTSTTISYPGWSYRFTPELVAFLRESAMLAIERLAAEAHGKLGDRLKQFKDVMIQDSTVIRLHQKLAKVFPATRARGVAAGAKVSLLISAVANGPKKVIISGERTADVKMLRVGPWVKDRILLVDLGYYKYQLFARIAENGGYFVTRLKENGNPRIVGSHTTHRGRAIDVEGKRWQDIVRLLRRKTVDLEIEIAFRRRKYNGRVSGDTRRVRLVAVWNEVERTYHAYLTNLPVEVLDAQEVADLYACRWAVELTFKELKSRYRLDQVPTAKRQVVEALIWTAILTLLVSRRYYNFIVSRAPKKNRGRYPRLRWAKVFAQHASDLLAAMLRYLGFVGDRRDFFELKAGVYSSQALDPHVKRERLLDGWWA